MEGSGVVTYGGSGEEYVGSLALTGIVHAKKMVKTKNRGGRGYVRKKIQKEKLSVRGRTTEWLHLGECRRGKKEL